MLGNYFFAALYSSVLSMYFLVWVSKILYEKHLVILNNIRKIIRCDSNVRILLCSSHCVEYFTFIILSRSPPPNNSEIGSSIPILQMEGCKAECSH